MGFLRLVRYLDDRRSSRGNRKKEDQMVSEEMRWQEGRLVMESNIVRGGSGPVNGKMGLHMKEGLGGKGGSGAGGYSKLRREI